MHWPAAGSPGRRCQVSGLRTGSLQPLPGCEAVCLSVRSRAMCRPETSTPGSHVHFVVCFFAVLRSDHCGGGLQCVHHRLRTLRAQRRWPLVLTSPTSRLQVTNRGVVGLEACTPWESRADPGTKALAVQRRRQL